MDLFKLINPAPERDLDIALFRLAQRNAIFEIVAPMVTPLAFIVGFGDTLDREGLYLWLSVLLGPILTGIWVWRILHANGANDPDAALLRRWRRANTIYLFLAGVGWGGIGFLYDGTHVYQNMAVLLTYLAVITISSNSSGVHSHRLYFIAVGITLMVMVPNLPRAFGHDAFGVGLLSLIYPFFLERLALSTRQILQHTIELQRENEQLLKERAIAMQLAERERIYRDLHDDVGAKLLGLAISAQRANQQREADLARSALQDLRDVVSRPPHRTERLDELLADWRAETTHRLQAAGLVLDWHANGEVPQLSLGATAALNLGRILRETVTNVIKHAGASRIAFRFCMQDAGVLLVIEDDGNGLPETAPRAGRGMNSMRSRAAALGGHIEWRPAPSGGCAVRISLALAELAAESA